MFYVYLIKSKKFPEELYVGYTADLKKRVTEHNRGLTFSTARYKPWELIYYEACIEETDAKRREKYLKTTHGKRMLKTRLKSYFYGKRKS